jgi:release factor glutamine methyltransferase
LKTALSLPIDNHPTVATVADSIRDLQRAFAESGIPTARLDAELLVGHVLGVDRTTLLAILREELPESAPTQISRLAERRLGSEPIAYLVGTKEFFGLPFIVGPAVLVPRPETELLVEWALQWLAEHPTASVVDVGTGSGAIAISIALNAPGADVTASDISDDALAIAQANAERLCPDRVTFHQTDLLKGIADRFNLIAANLPYLRTDQIDGNDELGAEPRLALDGGPDGLDLIAQLIRQVPERLGTPGAVAIELDPGQAAAVAAMLADAVSGAEVEVHQDLAGLDRFVTAVRI